MMLHDRLVCGVNNPIIQCWLLAEKALTFKTAMELSQGMESAAKNVKELTSQPADSSNGSESSIHKVTASQPQGHCCYCSGKPGRYMPLPASLEMQSTINVEKWAIYKKFVRVRWRNSSQKSNPRSQYMQWTKGLTNLLQKNLTQWGVWIQWNGMMDWNGGMEW